MKATAINDVISALVSTMESAVTYPVFDGAPSHRPARGSVKWLVIGSDDADNNPEEAAESARMEAEITGLGQVAREETIQVDCVAVGKADTIAGARTVATAVVEDVSQNFDKSPTSETYGAHISAVTAVKSHNVSGGAIVHIHFTVTAKARLT